MDNNAGAGITIRVYICAPFRDMKAERAHLHQVVFPQVSQRYQAQGAVLEVVDPYEGAPSEDAAEGPATFENSMNEIDRCRPYFIGIFGTNYGKVLVEIPDNLGWRYPTIRHFVRCSRTHLETLYGVLREPHRATHSFFYFRKPDFLGQVPVAEQKIYVPANALEALNEIEAHKLEIFKEAIVTAGMPVREYGCRWDAGSRSLTGLEEFGKCVTSDLMSLIAAPVAAVAKPLAATVPLAAMAAAAAVSASAPLAEAEVEEADEVIPFEEDVLSAPSAPEVAPEGAEDVAAGPAAAEAAADEPADIDLAALFGEEAGANKPAAAAATEPAMEAAVPTDQPVEEVTEDVSEIVEEVVESAVEEVAVEEDSAQAVVAEEEGEPLAMVEEDVQESAGAEEGGDALAMLEAGGEEAAEEEPAAVLADDEEDAPVKSKRRKGKANREEEDEAVEEAADSEDEDDRPKAKKKGGGKLLIVLLLLLLILAGAGAAAVFLFTDLL